ncbi:rhodanese-related sulfurtransferase [Alteraurantiacibacter aquimixticola]|uniref:tRNA uridine(34) hydroxylase n=1 Tax=Alteraurantiacibacter aquimixticola TaxID=2489173 RepID=A0A4T3F0W7_9SPHN|nr:rhodanese-related sulfurtransferase [Alteraurantiacibacter aquimixticola]TIX50594.1 rhodanese-related sulfurtransferase [Alteraurantiacibacter aquimixticola]
MTALPIRVAALYKFTRFDDPAAIRGPLLALCEAQGIAGTLLLAEEGINGTIAGTPEAIDAVLAHIRALPGCADIEVKFSGAAEMPFYRLKVRLKKEIVTLGEPGVDPTQDVGTYVDPAEWNALIADPDTIVIDTRNDYEVAIGQFEGAIDPETPSFRDFPAWFRGQRAKLLGRTNKPKVAMYCTGGIRCEKSTAFLKAEGIEDVYHLKGGILKYLEDIPEEESLWRGECFVFDERVSVGHGLKQGPYVLCRACRYPLGPEELASPEYEDGVSCPHCIADRTPEQRVRYAERQKQARLARKRGEQHVGDSHEDLRERRRAEKLAAKEAARKAAAEQDDG